MRRDWNRMCCAKSSPSQSIGSEEFRRCSTPFGIIEFITGKISRRLGSTFSAQRLSASSNSSLFTPATEDRPEHSAQRLSASSNSSRENDSPVNRSHPVLNAFRHHRIHHTITSGRSLSISSVLNAFRHHRIHHETALEPNSYRLRVLNAFRHHRIHHFAR